MDQSVPDCRLLVDFENIQKIDLSTVPNGFQVTIFVGSAQNTLPFDFVLGAQSLGDRLEWIKVEGKGRNALDFHIAYFVGCLLTLCPRTECIILSKDNGFDPLVCHLKKRGLHCRRITCLSELEPQAQSISDSNYTQLVAKLKKASNASRPKSRTTLSNYVRSSFSGKLSKVEVAHLVEQLFADGKVLEENKTLNYTF